MGSSATTTASSTVGVSACAGYSLLGRLELLEGRRDAVLLAVERAAASDDEFFVLRRFSFFSPVFQSFPLLFASTDRSHVQ